MAIERLTQSEFDEKKHLLLELSGKSIQLAELVCVGGLSIKDAAAQLGSSKQNGAQIMKRVEALFEGYPTDWERVEMWMPKSLAKDVRRQVSEARSALASGESKPA